MFENFTCNCLRSRSDYFCPSRNTGLNPTHTWVGENPCGNVCTSAHDVLHIQTGLDPSLSSSLSAHNPIHLSVMLEALAKQAHELSQVCRTVVLLQELQNGGRNCEIIPSQQMQHLCVMRIFWDDPPELQPGCYSELFPHQLMSGYNGPSQLQESLPGVFLPWSHTASSWNRLYWSPAAVYGGDDEVRQLWGDKNKYSQINRYYSDQEILHLTVLAKVQVLVNVIRNRIRRWRPHLRLALSVITMKPATWKKLFCHPENKKDKSWK